MGVRLQVAQLEDRVNPSHVIDLPAAGWAPPDDPGGQPALLAPSNSGPGIAVEAAPTTAQARYEIKFLTDMIDHHMMAVMTAELCEGRTVHEDLQQMCEDIVAAQMAEIEMMQGWLEEWYGITYEPQMTQGMERQVEKLAALEGAEFEIAFMERMIKHHEGAVKEGERCVERAYHPELIELCHDIIETQTAEIAQMQTWLSEWYGIDA
jgi:uncharacterized protein (DUF305 family)